MDEHVLYAEESGELEARELPGPIRAPIPLILQVSGLYEYRQQPVRWPTPQPVRPEPVRPVPVALQRGPAGETEDGWEREEPVLDMTATASGAQPIIFPLLREELRLDVDGRYPLMVASGTQHMQGASAHWIANLRRTGRNTWTGVIWYRDGAMAAFPYTTVEITATRSYFPNLRRARVTYSGGGAAPMTRTYRYTSAYARALDLEFDAVQGSTPVVSYHTGAHPNRPAELPLEQLTIEKVFQRAGFHVTRSGGDGTVPLTQALAGPDLLWDLNEMNDALMAYWSRFADRPQWALWTFFAGQAGPPWYGSLGGIMFDTFGPNHRQGCAIFLDSFIRNAPVGDPAPAAWVQRMRFWTACHEMGHCLNLAHSWQKALPASWIALPDDPLALSFMNYPHNYPHPDRQAEFFRSFEFRFTDAELLFLRHAPERFVEPGNAAWFDHHGFERAAQAAGPALRLELRVNRKEPRFEFLEPLVLELKLQNVSDQPQVVDPNLLRMTDEMTVVVKKQGRPARQFVPYARLCFNATRTVLMPGQSLYAPLFLSAGRNGFDLAEPGHYVVQVALHALGETDLVSNPLMLRVMPPMGYDEEVLAQDFYTEDVGRVLAFDGSRLLDRANATLREITEKLPGRRVALHAHVALGMPQIGAYKKYQVGERGEKRIEVLAARPQEAREQLTKALTEPVEVAAETLGHIEYKEYIDAFTDWLNREGMRKEAVKVQEELLLALTARQVPERVLQEVKARRDAYVQKREYAPPEVPRVIDAAMQTT